MMACRALLSNYKRRTEQRWFDHFRPKTQTEHMRQQTGFMMQLSTKIDKLDQRFASTEHLQSAHTAASLPQPQQADQLQHESNLNAILQAADEPGMFTCTAFLKDLVSCVLGLLPISCECANHMM